MMMISPVQRAAQIERQQPGAQPRRVGNQEEDATPVENAR